MEGEEAGWQIKKYRKETLKMMKGKIFLGETELKNEAEKVKGGFVEIANEKYYKISNYNQMPDFFMTIVSDSDHWMYLSSNGALSAGRKNRDNALFPYYTVDKIHDYKGKVGSRTICLVEKNDKTFLWEPFSDESERVYSIGRNLYKSIYGNKVIFEEINHDLGISFQYGWYNSEKYGWIKKSTLKNTGTSSAAVQLVDGICNLLPYGVDYSFQSEYSNLLDAYKKNELLESSKLGLFALSSIPVDRAEPSEALKSTTLWSHTTDKQANYLISETQLEDFKRGLSLQTELDIRAKRGAYYINSQYALDKECQKEWYMVAEVNQDACAVANLNAFICSDANIVELLEKDIAKGTKNLIKTVSNADGLQLGNEELGCARHFTNTLFNVMRGGIFAKGYLVGTADFRLFVQQCNKAVYKQCLNALNQLPEQINYTDLLSWVKENGKPELQRIAYEYLPLTFSRRHGDPSRPWNLFSIETKNADGSDKLNYQGNWRDIFQNWEALCLSFPEYVEGIIAKFVNASTADGYNPYRITREGIDWECPDPDDPWAYIGYWGDHQIIYLQKIFEQSEQFHPGKLDELLDKDIFVYANVPYRIKPFQEIVKNPKDTILFDAALNKEIDVLAEKIGADGKLLRDKSGQIIRTNLLEKVLATLLSKLSNFVPEAGIWLNTQRPEWNDANNALVGSGVSMVTLYYLRRFLTFWEEKLSRLGKKEIEISKELEVLLEKTVALFEGNTGLLKKGFSDSDRYHFTSVLGKAGAEYRQAIYNSSFSGKKACISTTNLVDFIQVTLKYINQSIQVNRRADGLYHAYNLISFKGKSISVRYLYEMLEGQVAVLSSGALSTEESLEVLDALKNSALFREDQFSYILYPDRQLPRFTVKNLVPTETVEGSELFKKLIADESSSILMKDEAGNYHFNGSFRNADLVNDALDNLDPRLYGDLIEKERGLILDAYENLFDHQSFTGRSGTFFGYEGLGSIYWHMVSKLLLACQECYYKGLSEKVDENILGRIKDHYYEIKAGIGLYKSPDLYGAFPTDAYSHTPANAGVKQPGLTGQVKEDVISRFGELGLRVRNGQIIFDTSLLSENEWIETQSEFMYFDVEGKDKSLNVYKGQLCFTFCQVPVVFKQGTVEQITIEFKGGEQQTYNGNTLNAELSAKVFKRLGELVRIEYETK